MRLVDDILTALAQHTQWPLHKLRDHSVGRPVLSALYRCQGEALHSIFLVDSLHYNKTLARIYFRLSDMLLGQTERRIGPYTRVYGPQRNVHHRHHVW